MCDDLCKDGDAAINTPRRNLFRQAGALAAVAGLGGLGLLTPQAAMATPLTRESREALGIEGVLQRLKQGNERFQAGQATQHDYLAQKRATRSGQYPGSIILSCIDSRAPAEIVMDIPIGDSFNARVAGNLVSPDVLASMEYACGVAGAKVLLVMGHTSCGAIKGAIDRADLGHLTSLVDRIRPSVVGTVFDGERSSANPAFVDAVARTHVLRTVQQIREQSRVLAELEAKGSLCITGGMYHLAGGRMEFLQTA
ncbi:carbonic anhydrase family protein [Stenotrophomonas maltophilia]|uniref:carbonic anhydrase family protein n=1 Tax=Stenotrophomonas maltophilia TaxID=40324 RepID=UPI0034DB046A